jgi:hypothetical protein
MGISGSQTRIVGQSSPPGLLSKDPDTPSNNGAGGGVDGGNDAGGAIGSNGGIKKGETQGTSFGANLLVARNNGG